MNKQWKIGLFLLLVAGLFYLPSACLAGNLEWKGINLTAQGMYKGFNLPLEPNPFNGYADALGGKQIPAGIAPNTCLTWMLLNYYSSSKLKDSKGDTVPGTHQLELMAAVPRLLYFWPWQPANPHVRLTTDILIPFATVHANLNLLNGVGNLGAGDGGIGDVMLAPVALVTASQPLSRQDKWWSVLWSSYFGPIISFPTGFHDSTDAFDVGSNVYSLFLYTNQWFNFPNIGPYGGMQVHMTMCYAHHWNNGDFGTGLLPANLQAALGPTTSYRSGDSFLINSDINFPIPYPALKNVVVGVNICYLTQVAEDQLAGSDIQNSMGTSLGIGPNLYYSKGPVSLAYRFDIEVYAANRFQGFNNWFQMTYVF